MVQAVCSSVGAQSAKALNPRSNSGFRNCSSVDDKCKIRFHRRPFAIAGSSAHARSGTWSSKYFLYLLGGIVGDTGIKKS